MLTKTFLGQFALDSLNNDALHEGYINYVLHKSIIANKLNHAETRTSAYK